MKNKCFKTHLHKPVGIVYRNEVAESFYSTDTMDKIRLNPYLKTNATLTTVSTILEDEPSGQSKYLTSDLSENPFDIEKSTNDFKV